MDIGLELCYLGWLCNKTKQKPYGFTHENSVGYTGEMMNIVDEAYPYLADAKGYSEIGHSLGLGCYWKHRFESI